mgnify:FL=1
MQVNAKLIKQALIYKMPIINLLNNHTDHETNKHYVGKEFDHLVFPSDPRFCVWCNQCSCNSPFALPCCHTIVPGQIDLTDIHPRWLDPVAQPTRTKVD